jgi:malonyl-CoA/methylmalonyl-CoA synthetase
MNPLYDSLFGAHAGRDAPFLLLPDGGSLSYAAFLARAARIAHVLVAQGLAPGDRLAAQVEKSPEALALYAACAQTGVVFLPLNTAYTRDELAYFVENSGARLLVGDAAKEGELAPMAEGFGAGFLTLNGDGSGTLMVEAGALRDGGAGGR